MLDPLSWAINRTPGHRQPSSRRGSSACGDDGGGSLEEGRGHRHRCIQNQFVGNLRGQRRPDVMSDENKKLLALAGSAAGGGPDSRADATRKDMVVVKQA
jgi:hypothetical protein